jgi:hypothetical protein
MQTPLLKYIIEIKTLEQVSIERGELPEFLEALKAANVLLWNKHQATRTITTDPTDLH